MSIEALKQQARRHEQNEEWQKALDHYKKAINALAEDDQADIGLINRVGDLFVRVGKLDDAVDYYEQAVDLYREAYLPNNAIAVCKKIIRNVPGHHHAYLKIGQIRAEQGFLPDARTNFLMYAERMQRAGDLDESFRALVEFCDLAPDDVDLRITIADQMVASDRKEDAVQQLLTAYGRLTQSGETDLADGVERRIHELDPGVDVGAAVATMELGAAEDDSFGGFGEIEFDEPADEVMPHEEEEVEVVGGSGFEISGSADVDDVTESLEEASEEAAELPMMGYGEEADEPSVTGWDEEDELPTMGFDEEEDADELPTMAFDERETAEPSTMGSEEEEEEEDELPTTADDLPGFDDETEEDEDAADLPLMSYDADAGEVDEPGPPVAAPETAPVAEALEEAVEEAAPAEAEVGEAPAAEPSAGGGEFVDLGAMILGGREDRKTTRFKVAYEEPSGDEQADFDKMLSQFKEKVSENLDAGDVRAHYDLGTAYKEMGLLEEAISSFQQALRASSTHLPTYEQMGQTFLEMGQPEAAVRTLERALRLGSTVEDDFVGIYYYLARAFEALDNKASAVEYYDRVFALDINFADVTDRLRELR